MTAKKAIAEHHSLRDLTEQQYFKYFETRLQQLRRSGSSFMAKCIFHEDSKPSLSVRPDRGIWKCHGCGKGGGIIDMELLLGDPKDTQAAIARIADIVGLPQLKLGGGPEAVYQYRDPQGIPVFQVVRFPGKKFMQRKRAADGSWDWKTSDTKMVLYNLPEVICAKEVFIVEGEKDADRLMDTLEAAGMRPKVAGTTSPRGAGKWLDEFAPYFIGKKVVIIEDNDEPGRRHGSRIAESIFPYAYGIKKISFDSGKDVSDFLLAGKTLADLAQIIKNAEQWKPSLANSGFSLYEPFEGHVPDKIEWLVEGVAETKSNGMLISRPKGGKSVCILDLAVALATGTPWLQFFVPKRVRVAVMSREDNPATTGHRLRKIRLGRNLAMSDLNGWLWINTREQTKSFLLDHEDEVATLIADLLKHQIEVLILDVMRVLHSAEENDNTEMQVIINTLNRIRDVTGVTIIVVHHSRKGEDEATLTDMARGASAIAGWCEWIAGIGVVDKHEWVRSMEIELKGGLSPEKFYWKIQDEYEAGVTKIRLVNMPKDYKPPKKAQPWPKKKQDGGTAKDEPTAAAQPEREPGEDDDVAF